MSPKEVRILQRCVFAAEVRILQDLMPLPTAFPWHGLLFCGCKHLVRDSSTLSRCSHPLNIREPSSLLFSSHLEVCSHWMGFEWSLTCTEIPFFYSKTVHLTWVWTWRHTKDTAGVPQWQNGGTEWCKHSRFCTGFVQWNSRSRDSPTTCMKDWNHLTHLTFSISITLAGRTDPDRVEPLSIIVSVVVLNVCCNVN